jgi:hypothetical protein
MLFTASVGRGEGEVGQAGPSRRVTWGGGGNTHAQSGPRHLTPHRKLEHLLLSMTDPTQLR